MTLSHWIAVILFIGVIIFLDREKWMEAMSSVKRDWKEARRCRKIRKDLERRNKENEAALRRGH